MIKYYANKKNFSNKYKHFKGKKALKSVRAERFKGCIKSFVFLTA